MSSRCCWACPSSKASRSWRRSWISHPPDVSQEESEAMAVRYRLDLKTAEDQIDDARRSVAVAKMAFSRKSTSSPRRRSATATTPRPARLDERTTTYSAGVTIDLPVDRVAERNISAAR